METRKPAVGIVTDSHSGINGEQAREMGIFIVPMPFHIDGVCYYENVNLTRDEFMKMLPEAKEISTSQPSPTDVMEIWDQALRVYDEILYIPISSGLSGSCGTAMMLAGEEEYDGRVFVVDNGRVSTPLLRSIYDAREMIQEGYSAAEIKKSLEDAKHDMVIYIGVETLEYLHRGGRISGATATIGGMLNIKPILKLDVGVLDNYKKCRGFHKAKKAMIEALKEDIETRFKEQYDKGEVYILAATSASAEETETWVREIEDAFPGHKVLCDFLSCGVSCHIGPGGLGIGCSCRPRRPER